MFKLYKRLFFLILKMQFFMLFFCVTFQKKKERKINQKMNLYHIFDIKSFTHYLYIEKVLLNSLLGHSIE